MSRGSGFYKYDGKELLHGPNYVLHKNHKLLRDVVVTALTRANIKRRFPDAVEGIENYAFPIDGWRWFESEELARDFWGLPPPDEDPFAVP